LQKMNLTSHRQHKLIPLAMLLVSTVFAQDSQPLGDVALRLRAEQAQTVTISPNARADQILNLVAETYKHCTTYSDSGVLTTTDTPGRTRTSNFSTAFVRPDRFRFEYHDENLVTHGPDLYLVWRQGQDVRFWSDLATDVKSAVSSGIALHSAIAMATGVTLGSSFLIPSLLLPDEISGRYLTDMKSATRLDDARLGEVNCFRIQGKLAKYSTTIWIDSKTLLIRKIETADDFDSFHNEQTITYEPVINEQVPQQKLAFSPPTR
jgi:outer membrane lipoprotein-sorting protein